MNANELADELDKYKGIATRDASDMLRRQAHQLEYYLQQIKRHADKIDEQQAEIEALKKQLDRKDYAFAAQDMMLNQFEEKFGYYEESINGSYHKVSVEDFIRTAEGKEHIFGKPVIFAEWPRREE